HSCGKSPKFMCRPGKTIGTAVFAALIRIHGIFKRKIRAFDFIDNRLREYFCETRFYSVRMIVRFKRIAIKTVDNVLLRTLSFYKILIFHAVKLRRTKLIK